MKTKKVPCEVYSRVCGFYRPTREWNKGKKSEFDERTSIHIDWEPVKDKSQE